MKMKVSKFQQVIKESVLQTILLCVKINKTPFKQDGKVGFLYSDVYGIF